MSTALFVGHARPPSNTVTAQLYKVLSVVLEIDLLTGNVVAADVTVSSAVARDYLVRLLVGRNLMGELGTITRDIERNYHSPTQRAVVQALHDVGNKYMSAFLKQASSQFGDLDL
jgi:hypothetical protein